MRGARGVYIGMPVCQYVCVCAFLICYRIFITNFFTMMGSDPGGFFFLLFGGIAEAE